MISLNLSEPRDPARHRSGQPGQPSSHRARQVSATTSANPIPILSTYDCASPDEDGIVQALEGALADGRLSSEDIQYANAHETGTAAMMKPRYKPSTSEKHAISSSKSMVGHALDAAEGWSLSRL